MINPNEPAAPAVKKARTPEELIEIRRQSHRRMTELQHHVLVCRGGCCVKRGSYAVYETLKAAKNSGVWGDRVRVNSSLECVGRCGDECPVVVYPSGVWHRSVTPDNAVAIVESHVNGAPRDESHIAYVYVNGEFRRSPDYPL